MKAASISIFIISLLKLITPSPVNLWLEKRDSDGDITTNAEKEPLVPPWVAMENTPGKQN